VQRIERRSTQTAISLAGYAREFSAAHETTMSSASRPGGPPHPVPHRKICPSPIKTVDVAYRNLERAGSLAAASAANRARGSFPDPPRPSLARNPPWTSG